MTALHTVRAILTRRFTGREPLSPRETRRFSAVLDSDMTLELVQSDQEVWHRTDRNACPAAGHVVMKGDYVEAEIPAEPDVSGLDGAVCADCFPDYA